jgi:hypothetical protein
VFNLQTTGSQQLEYTKKIQSISSAVSSMNRKINTIEQQIHQLDERISSLPVRIARVRQQKYLFLRHMEKIETSIAVEWARDKSNLLSNTRKRKTTIHRRLQKIQRDLVAKKLMTNQKPQNLTRIDARLSDIQLNVTQLHDHVTHSTRNMWTTVQNLEKDLVVAETTVDLANQASFQWKHHETPVLAVKANDLNNDIKGIITFTNQRIIFEGKKDVVIKKRLFIVTEKKTVREVILEKPIGLVQSLTKGRVGLLKGSGIFIEFKPQSGLSDMKLDTKGHEADWMVRFYNFILSGHADEELEKSDETRDTRQTAPQLVTCQMCGAPFDEEIYKGQTSVKCKYCGAVISLG